MSDRRTLAVLALLPLGVYALGVLWLIGTDVSNQGDFQMFYQSAQRWDFRAGNLNHPLVTALFVPLTWLRLETAILVWRVLSVILTVAAGWWLAEPHHRLRVIVALLIWYPSQLSFDEGQTGALLLVAGLSAWRGSRVGLACLILLKPIFVWWLLPAKDRGRVVAYVASAVLFGVLVFGVEPWLAWWQALLDKPVDVRPSNLSLASFVGLWHWPAPTGAILRVLMAGLVLWRYPDSWLLTGLAALLTSPIGWAYYLLALAGPIYERGTQHRAEVALVILAFLPLAVMVPRPWFATVAVLWVGWLTLTSERAGH